MKGPKHRTETIGDFQDAITDFDRKYPNALNDEAVEHIKTSGKTKGIVLLGLIGSIISIWICVFLFQIYPQHPVLFVVFSMFIMPLILWKFITTSMKFWSGRSALKRNAVVASIPTADLRELRKAFLQIRSWREAQVGRKHNGNNPAASGMVGGGMVGMWFGAGSGGQGGDSDGCS
ncbi:MAG: hypothetical protein ACR2RF_30635 [Geminicoccaceae bacterium]